MDLTKGKVFKCLLLYSVPLMITLVLQQAYSVVDTIIVGRYCGAHDLAVVSAASTVFSFLYNVIISLAVGIGINTGLRHGAGDTDYVRDLSVTAFRSFLVLGILTASFMILFARPLLVLLQTPSEILDKSVLVLRLYAVSTFFYSLIASMTTQINALGYSRITLIIGISCGFLNIVLELAADRGLHTAVLGTVVASLICQALQVLASRACLKRRLPGDAGRKGHFIRKGLQDSLPLSASAVLQGAATNLALVVVQARINSCGVSFMNGASVALLTFSLLNNAINGYAQGYQGFLSVNTGAGCADRIRQGIRTGLVTGMIFALLICGPLLYASRPVGILMLGCGDETALSFAFSYCLFLLPAVFLSALAQLTGARLRVRRLTGIFPFSSLCYALITIAGSLAVPTVMVISAAQTVARAAETVLLLLYLRAHRTGESPAEEPPGQDLRPSSSREGKA